MSSLAYPQSSKTETKHDATRLAGRYAQLMGDVYSGLIDGPVDICTPTEVARHAADVMTRARARRVLIHDGDTTLSMQRASAWQVEQAVWFLLARLIPDNATDVSDLGPAKFDTKTVDWLVGRCISSFAHRPEPHPAYTSADPENTEADYKATELHRRTREVLDRAKEKPVTVEHKGTRLTIDDWARERVRVGVLAALDDVRQFLVARSLHGDEEIDSWAFATPYPWVAVLPHDDVEAFAGDLFPYLLEAVRRESVEPFLANLRGWQATAEVVSSDALRERLARRADASRVAQSESSPAVETA